MLIRVTNEFGAGFTVFVQKANLDRVIDDYKFMGFSSRRL